jgi:transcriptional regulator with XRE-family HTH domain
MAKPEVEHMLHILKTTMRLLGVTNRDVERKLGLSSSYLSRLFSSSIELRYEHIVDIAGALGMRPEEILYLAYSELPEPLSEPMQKVLRTMGRPVKPSLGSPVASTTSAPAAPAAPTEQEIEAMMAKAFRRFFGQLAQYGEGTGEEKK